MKTEWTKADSVAAFKEGWGLYSCHGSGDGTPQVQANDGQGLLENDLEAWALVQMGKKEHHEKARRILQKSNPAEYHRVMGAAGRPGVVIFLDTETGMIRHIAGTGDMQVLVLYDKAETDGFPPGIEVRGKCAEGEGLSGEWHNCTDFPVTTGEKGARIVRAVLFKKDRPGPGNNMARKGEGRTTGFPAHGTGRAPGARHFEKPAEKLYKTVRASEMKDREYFWTMENGERINVDDMTESHLRNALKLMIKRSEERDTCPHDTEDTMDMANREGTPFRDDWMWE